MGRRAGPGWWCRVSGTSAKVVAVVGLGRIGGAVAERLREQGHEVATWNRTPRTIAGTTALADASAALDADLVVLALFDGPSTLAVLDEMLVAHRSHSTGLVVIDLATMSPDERATVAARATAVGLGYLEAPILGSVPAVRSGSLKILCGSDDAAALADARPVLDDLSDDVRFVGPIGTASRLKLLSNAALALATRATREALALGEALDLPQTQVLDVLALGHLARIATGKRQRLEQGDHSGADFTLSALRKDLALALASAGAAARQLPELTRVAAEVEAAAARHPDDDFSRLLT